MQLRILRLRIGEGCDRIEPAHPTHQRAVRVRLRLDAVNHPEFPVTSFFARDVFVTENDQRVTRLEIFGDAFKVSERIEFAGSLGFGHPGTHGVPYGPRIDERFHGLERLWRLARTGHALHL